MHIEQMTCVWGVHIINRGLPISHIILLCDRKIIIQYITGQSRWVSFHNNTTYMHNIGDQECSNILNTTCASCKSSLLDARRCVYRRLLTRVVVIFRTYSRRLVDIISGAWGWSGADIIIIVFQTMGYPRSDVFASAKLIAKWPVSSIDCRINNTCTRTHLPNIKY